MLHFISNEPKCFCISTNRDEGGHNGRTLRRLLALLDLVWAVSGGLLVLALAHPDSYPSVCNQPVWPPACWNQLLS